MALLKLRLVLFCRSWWGTPSNHTFGGKKFEYHHQLAYQTTLSFPQDLWPPPPNSSVTAPPPFFLYTHNTAHHVPHAAVTDAQAGIGPGPARIVRQHHQLQRPEESAFGAGAASRLFPGRAQPDERRRLRHCVDRLHEADAGQAQRHGCRSDIFSVYVYMNLLLTSQMQAPISKTAT